MKLRTDHVAGGVAILIGIVLLALSGDLPLGTLSFPGAGMWPKLNCAFLIVLGTLLLVRAADSALFADINWRDVGHATSVIAATAAAVALYTTLGFIVSMALLLAGLALLERRKVIYAAVYGIGVSVAVYALFTVVLRSPLERGLIGF